MSTYVKSSGALPPLPRPAAPRGPQAGDFFGADLTDLELAGALDKAAREYARMHGGSYWSAVQVLTSKPEGAR